MRSLRLRKCPVRFGLGSMDKVGKLNGVLNEENRDIVPDEVPVALLGVHLHRKAPDVACKVGRSLAPSDSRKPDEYWRSFTCALEKIGTSIRCQRIVRFEETVRSVASCMDDALGNTFMIEVKNLLPEMKVVDQCRASGTDA
jgi:hypothetical protein